MAPMDAAVPRGDLLWAARLEVHLHEDPPPADGVPRCTDCLLDGTCPRLAGARLVVAQHERREAL